MPHKDLAVRKIYAKKYQEANKEKIALINKKWRESNKEKIKEISLLNYENNKHRYIANARKRENKIKHHQTPAWADMDAINTIYKQATRRSQIEGRQYHVDHIIPLNGKEVSGLHTADNLQILLASENLSKGNRIYAN